MLPQPKTDLVGLGVLLDLTFIDPAGELNIWEMDPQHQPILWWDDEIKALYAFPHEPYPTCKPIPQDMSRAAHMYRRWSKRDPQCFDEIRVPDVMVKAVGAADTVSYASDKWNKRNPDPRLLDAQQYIHDHWYDVWVWADTDEGTPEVIMIEGCALDVHERGIIH